MLLSYTQHLTKARELPYWITLAHIPKWSADKVNRLVIRIVHEKALSLEDFFNFSEQQWQTDFDLEPGDISDLLRARKELPNNSFLAEDLFAQGFAIIPINSPHYSETLKENLKTKYAPPVLYAKGNLELLKKNAVAVVGSRNASELSLQFTNNIADKAASEGKVVVSGYAKGVDRQALDCALKHGGTSIIVLPQGIMTFASGFNAYYRHIVAGSVLVLSAFHPKAPWSVGLAMARNPFIYGIAREIYVAQSSTKGGTWEGVLDGLRKGRTIYVRSPEPREENANQALIAKGALPVDSAGNQIHKKPTRNKEFAAEEIIPYLTANELDLKIREALNNKSLTSRQIVELTESDWSPQKMSKYLKGLKFVECLKTKPQKFRIKDEGCKQQALFG